MRDFPQEFMDQNELAAKTLKIEDIGEFAEHHSGGLIVLGSYYGEGRYVKMHDSWGDEGTVVVHAYDPDAAEDSEEAVEHFPTGAEALERFLAVVNGPALPTMTAGQIIRALQKHPADTPVLVYDEAAGWYRNVRLIDKQDEDMAINIGAADTYDTRQW